MMSRHFIAFAGALLLFAGVVDAQNIAQDPLVISTGPKLDPRTAVMPYSSREAALVQNRDSTDYIIPLTKWTKESVPGGTRYTTSFKIPYTWHDRVIIFRNTGASSSFSIEFNGANVGYSQLSAGRVEFDLTKSAQENYNTLSVVLYDNVAARAVESSRSKEPFAGEAYIIVQPNVYVKDFDIETAFDNMGRGHLAVGVVMKNTLLNPKDYTVYYELISPSGDILDKGTRSFTANPRTEETVRFSTTVSDVVGWSHEMPYLYTIVIKTQHEGRYKEYVAQNVGFRIMEYDNGQVLLNGKPIPLSIREYEWNGNEDNTCADLMAMKSEGMNCIVVKGGPQSDMLYALCDREGLYVIDQAMIDASSQSKSLERGGTPSNNPEWVDSYRERVEQMYYSSRLNPSIVGFSTARNSSNGYCLQEAYITLKSKSDGRPVVYFEANGEWNNDPIAKSTGKEGSEGPLFVLTGGSSGDVTIRNSMDFGFVEGTLTYGIKKGKNISKAVIRPVTLAPGEQMTVRIPLKEGKSAEAGIRIEIPTDGFRYDPLNTDVAAKNILFEGSVKISN